MACYNESTLCTRSVHILLWWYCIICIDARFAGIVVILLIDLWITFKFSRALGELCAHCIHTQLVVV